MLIALCTAVIYLMPRERKRATAAAAARHIIKWMMKIVDEFVDVRQRQKHIQTRSVHK
jgi:hypothetical protein